VVVDGDELAGAEAELVEVRAARAAALTRSTELARAGNDVAASNAARAARDFATAARALAGEVVLLREAGLRLTQAQGEEIAGALQGFVERLELPWTGAVRQLLSECLRLAAGKEVPDIDRTAGRAADELHKHYAALVVREAPAPDTRIDTEAAPASRSGGDRSVDSATGSHADPLGAEPKPAPLAHVRGDVVEDELVLCDMGAVPAEWFSRFQLGADGRERCRRAYSEFLRDQQRKREAAEAAAAEAETVRAKAAGSERAARVPGPARDGWDGRRGGRGHGPAGRAGE
jgi:hypothetical protein